jgi:hypothetical protein
MREITNGLNYEEEMFTTETDVLKFVTQKSLHHKRR